MRFKSVSNTNLHESRIGFQSRLLHCFWLVQPCGTGRRLALDREGSSRYARNTQLRYDEIRPPVAA
jgi:hypothetical protein